MASDHPLNKWKDRINWLVAGIQVRNRWRLLAVVLEVLIAGGRRVRLLRVPFNDPQRVLMAINDSTTKRDGPKLRGAGTQGLNRISLARRIGTFLATHRTLCGSILVLIVSEKSGPTFFNCADPNVSVSKILEAAADRAAIEQVFHDVKEVLGSGQQQISNMLAYNAVWHPNLCGGGGTLSLRSNSCNATTRSGTIPQGDPLTPTAAMPCAPPACSKNSHTLCPQPWSPQNQIPTLTPLTHRILRESDFRMCRDEQS